MFGNLNATILTSLLPVIQKNLTEENAVKYFDSFVETFPLDPGESKNIITITKIKDQVFFQVVGVDSDNKITKLKERMTLVAAVTKLLNLAK